VKVAVKEKLRKKNVYMPRERGKNIFFKFFLKTKWGGGVDINQAHTPSRVIRGLLHDL